MARQGEGMEVPPGSEYAVSPLRRPFGTYFFGNFEDTLNFVSVNDLAFCCQVTRMRGDVLVWPIHSPGGSA